MEYQQWTVDDQRDQLKGELRTYEQQHANRWADANKYRKLLAAKDSGEFKNWDSRVLLERDKDWRNQLKVAEADIDMMTLLIRDAKDRYEAFEATTPVTDTLES